MTFTGWLLIVVGAWAFAQGVAWLISGRNVGLRLGRPIRRGTDISARAPAIYFRAIGTFGICMGLLIALFGTVQLRGSSDWPLAAVAVILLIGAAVAMLWAWVLADRNKLFPWSKR